MWKLLTPDPDLGSLITATLQIWLKSGEDPDILISHVGSALLHSCHFFFGVLHTDISACTD